MEEIGLQPSTTRLEAFLPLPAREALVGMKPALIELSRTCRAENWCGQRLDLLRYSGRQKRN